jgi:O-antigen/teichoic acid export membrane protein
MVILKWIKNNEFAYNVVKLITGTAFGQLILILVSPVLTRLYSTTDFGIFAVYLSLSGILSVVISLRFETAILLPEDDEEATDLTILGIYVSFFLSLILLIIFYIFNDPIIQLIGHPELGFYLLLIPLSTLFYGCYQVLSFWMSRKKEFSYLAASKTIKDGGTAGLQLGSGWITNTGAFGLIAGQIIGNMIGFTFLFTKTYIHIKQRLFYGIIKNLSLVFKKYKKFPQFTSIATLINSISQNFPALLLASFYSAETAGFYAVASRVITAPSILIGNSMRQVYYQRASQMFNEGHSIFKLFKKSTFTLGTIALLPFLVIIIWGKPLFIIIFGDQWGEAGVYASILSLWIFVGFLNPPAAMSLFILKLNRVHLVWEILLLIFRVLAICTGFYIFNDVLISLGFYAAIGIIFNIFLIGLIYFKLKT